MAESELDRAQASRASEAHDLTQVSPPGIAISTIEAVFELEPHMNPARRCVIVSGAAFGLAAALGGLPARAADDESAAAAWVRKAEATVNAFAQNPDLGDFR